MNTASIRVLLADDHAVLRAGLRALLNGEPNIIVIGEAGNGRETLEQVHLLQPDIVVLDLMMPEVKGIDIIDQLVQEYPHTRILVLTMHADTEYIRRVAMAGASGYVLKSSADTELIQAIREVAAGKSYLTSEATKALLEDYRGRTSPAVPSPEPAHNNLSEREHEVLVMTALGYSSKEVGDMLFISPKTVDTYRQRVMEKLNLESRAELVQYALKHGLLETK